MSFAGSYAKSIGASCADHGSMLGLRRYKAVRHYVNVTPLDEAWETKLCQSLSIVTLLS